MHPHTLGLLQTAETRHLVHPLSLILLIFSRLLASPSLSLSVSPSPASPRSIHWDTMSKRTLLSLLIIYCGLTCTRICPDSVSVSLSISSCSSSCVQTEASAVAAFLWKWDKWLTLCLPACLPLLWLSIIVYQVPRIARCVTSAIVREVQVEVLLYQQMQSTEECVIVICVHRVDTLNFSCYARCRRGESHAYDYVTLSLCVCFSRSWLLIVPWHTRREKRNRFHVN